MVAALALSVLSLSSLALGASSHAASSHKKEAVATITEAAKAKAVQSTSKSSSTVTSAYPTDSPLPLTDYVYAYDKIVNPYPVGRGPQSGYNICNNSTAGADSQCQTLIVNDIDDFCLWGSPTAEGQIGDVEAAVVAYCTPKNAHGSRSMPDGTITGLQFITTSAYIQITGFLNQEGVGLMSNDTGGELDPHGADLLGNPLGGLVYSSYLAEDNSTELQAMNWNLFIGSNTFCLKLCYNNITKPDYCQNKFDLIGCAYNMPSANVDGEFLKCDGDLQDPAGVYTLPDGKTTLWSQPEVIPATLPWTPRVPASSNCVTYSSAELFGSASKTTSVTRATTTSVTSTSTTSAVTTRPTTTAIPSTTSVTSTTSSVPSVAPLSTSSVAPAATTSAKTSGGERLAVGGAMAFVLVGAVAMLF